MTTNHTAGGRIVSYTRSTRNDVHGGITSLNPVREAAIPPAAAPAPPAPPAKPAKSKTTYAHGTVQLRGRRIIEPRALRVIAPADLGIGDAHRDGYRLVELTLRNGEITAPRALAGKRLSDVRGSASEAAGRWYAGRLPEREEAPQPRAAVQVEAVREVVTAPERPARGTSGHSRAGERWITLHPSPGENQPVLIRGRGADVTIAGGLGGRFTGQKLSEALKPAQQPATHEGVHARFNKHMAPEEFGKLTSFGVNLTVHGVPTHHGKGEWSAHLKEVHPGLVAQAHATGRTDAGASITPHPDGGVIYRAGAQQAGPYEHFAREMAKDVTNHRIKEATEEHERRLRDAEDEEYRRETEKEMAREREQQMLDVRRFIRAEGGIRPHRQTASMKHDPRDSDEWRSMPKWAKGLNSRHTADTMAHLVAAEFPDLGIESENDLLDYLASHERERVGGYTARAREADVDPIAEGAAAARGVALMFAAWN